jgi:hypothetical protein
MPKFVGSKLADMTLCTRLEDNARTPAGYVRLTYAQARLLPPVEIAYSLDTTDRGSRGVYAKRWYRWFALAAAVRACPQATPKMLAACTSKAETPCPENDE